MELNGTKWDKMGQKWDENGTFEGFFAYKNAQK